MHWTLWNPVAGQHLDWGDLCRSAVPEARVVLEAAAAHCASRVNSGERALAALTEALFPLPTPSLPCRPPGIDGFDILVAAACLAREEIARRLPNGLDPGASKMLDEKHAQLCAIPVDEFDGLPLAEPYARRWAWNRRVHSWNQGVTVDTLLGSLIFEEFEHLADWDRGYVAGDYTHLEIASRMWAPSFEDCPSPYIECRGELDALDALMAQHRGVFIVAANCFAAFPLVRTWLAPHPLWRRTDESCAAVGYGPHRGHIHAGVELGMRRATSGSCRDSLDALRE